MISLSVPGTDGASLGESGISKSAQRRAATKAKILLQHEKELEKAKAKRKREKERENKDGADTKAKGRKKK
jgi:hypothetical protein